MIAIYGVPSHSCFFVCLVIPTLMLSQTPSLSFAKNVVSNFCLYFSLSPQWNSYDIKWCNMPKALLSLSFFHASREHGICKRSKAKMFDDVQASFRTYEKITFSSSIGRFLSLVAFCTCSSLVAQRSFCLKWVRHQQRTLPSSSPSRHSKKKRNKKKETCMYCITLRNCA